MITRPRTLACRGFTLLEMVIVLLITGMVLGAVYTITQGTLTLADEARRAQRRDTREQAFTAFGERLFASLGATTSLNMKASESGGEYLGFLELRRVPSPFDGAPDRIVTLFGEAAPGGGVRLMLGVRLKDDDEDRVKVVLMEDIATCEWRAYDPATRQWATKWVEPVEESSQHVHPPLIELSTTSLGGEVSRRVFWLAPNTPPTIPQITAPGASGTPPVIDGGTPPAAAVPP